jgi:DNA repair protein RadD
VEIFKIDHITYSMHTKADRPPMMKVTYYCQLRSFDEYVCFEHTGFALHKAHKWWKERANRASYPTTTVEALQWATMLQAPTHVSVWLNKKYPELQQFCFDGTAFGKHAPVDGPKTNVWSGQAKKPYEAVEEDDIPF